MENKSAFAIIQIGVGIICLSIGIGIFLQFWVDYVLGATLLFLGTGVLLHGVTNNNTGKSEKGKRLSLIATICVVIASVLIFYNLFFNSK